MTDTNHKTPSDRELLDTAAKAAGLLDGAEWFEHELCYCVKGKAWDPLTDDGDEARLEAALGLSLWWYPACVLVGPSVCGAKTEIAYAEYFDQHAGDKQAARRLAGVKAAAHIGAAL